MVVLEVKTDNSSNESLFPDEKPKANNKNNPALDRKGSRTRQSADTWWLGPLKGGSQHSVLRTSYVKPLSTICVMVAHASVASSKPKVEIDSHADIHAVGDNCLVIHDHNRQINVYNYNPKDRSAKTVDVTVGYQDPQSGQKFILIINQAICIDGLENHSICPMQCHLNGVHISEVPKFLAESPSETTHAIELVNSFNAAHQLVILLQLNSVTSYFDVYSLIVAEYEKGDIPKVHFTADEPPWDSSTSKYIEREICMLHH